MGKGSSSSESTQTTQTSTTTENYDQRVGADNGAVVIQAGGQQNISFSKEVADAAAYIVNSLTDFSGQVVTSAKDIVNASLSENEKLVNSVLDFGKSSLAASPATTETKSAGIIDNQNKTTINPNLLIGGAVAAAVVVYLITKKKG